MFPPFAIGFQRNQPKTRRERRLTLCFRNMREWLSGRASPCQGERREFESRFPLHEQNPTRIRVGFCSWFFLPTGITVIINGTHVKILQSQRFAEKGLVEKFSFGILTGFCFLIDITCYMVIKYKYVDANFCKLSGRKAVL